MDFDERWRARTVELRLILRRGRSVRGVVLKGTLCRFEFVDEAELNCCRVGGVYFVAWSRDSARLLRYLRSQ
jgi:hypothetical protein